MNQHTNIFTIISAIALALAIALAPILQADEEIEESTGLDTKVMKCCQAIETLKTQIHGDMEEKDAEITQQLDAIKVAPEEDKLTLMTEAIDLLSEERLVMKTQFNQLEEAMTNHLVEHINMSSKPELPTADLKSVQGSPALLDSTQKDQ